MVDNCKVLHPNPAQDLAGYLRKFDELQQDYFDDPTNPQLANLMESAQEEVWGVMTRAVGQQNKAVGALLGMDRRLGKFIAKAMFMSPGSRLNRHELFSARTAVNLFTKSGAVEDNLAMAAVEPVLKMVEVHTFKSLAEQRSLYTRNRGKLGDITDDEFFTMAGHAQTDGKLDLGRTMIRAEDGQPFSVYEKIADNPEAQRLVAESAALAEEFDRQMVRLGGDSGAMTITQLAKTNHQSAFEGVHGPHVSRVVNRTLAMNNRGRFVSRIRLGLEQKRDQWMTPEEEGGRSKMQIWQDHYNKQIDDLASEIEDMKAKDELSGDADHKYDIEQAEHALRYAQKQSEELTELQSQLLDRIDDLAEEVAGGYLGDTGNPLGTGASASSIKKRIMTIPEQYLEMFMVRDTRMMMQHKARTLLPDLIISRRMAISMNKQDLSGEADKNLNRIADRLRKAFDKEEDLTPELFDELAELGDRVKVDAAYMNLIDYVRLIKSTDELGADVAATEADRERLRIPTVIDKAKAELLDQVLAGKIDENEGINKGLFSYNELKLHKARRRKAELDAERDEQQEAHRKALTQGKYYRASWYRMSDSELSRQIADNTLEDGTIRDDGFYYVLVDPEAADAQRLPSANKPKKGDSSGYLLKSGDDTELALTDLSGISRLKSDQAVAVRVPKDAMPWVDKVTGARSYQDASGARLLLVGKSRIPVLKWDRRKKQPKPRSPAADPAVVKERKEVRAEITRLERGELPPAKPTESSIWSRLPKNPGEAMEMLQDYIYKMKDARHKAQKELRDAERTMRDVEEGRSSQMEMARDMALKQMKSASGGPIKSPARALGKAWQSFKDGSLDPDSDLGILMSTLQDYFTAKEAADEARMALRKNATEFHAIADKVRKQNRATIGQPIEDLSFRTTRMNVVRVGDREANTRELSFALESLIDEVSNRRMAHYQHNLDTLQLKRMMEREARFKVSEGELTEEQANKLLYGRDPISGQSDPRQARRGSAVNDIDTIVLRLRMRHGKSDDSWRYAGKFVRDLNFTRAMGSVLISSIPDMAMAIGQVGMLKYMVTLGKYLRKDFHIFSEDERGRSDMSVLMWAMETTVGMERTRTQYGVDFTSSDPSVAAGKKAQRAVRAGDAMVNNFAKLTLIDKWNGLNKGIAAMAIQHRSADVCVRLHKGEKVKEYEIQRLLSAGYSRGQLADFGEQILKSGESETGSLGGTYYYAKSATWERRDLALMWEAGIIKQVNDTIVTPGAGDLPTIATESELGRMLFQFRNFSIAVTQRMILPNMQRLFKHGDPAIVVQMVSMWILGMSVFAINEFLKGRDPFADIEGRDGVTRGAWRKWVLEGLDRSGVLGIATELNASLERFGLPGMASAIGAPAASRFSSRGPMESLAGPAIGTVFDIGSAVAGVSDTNITKGEGALLRRMIPYQNWIGTRILLDVAPSAFAGKALYGDDYYDNYKPVQDRIFNYD